MRYLNMNTKTTDECYLLASFISFLFKTKTTIYQTIVSICLKLLFQYKGHEKFMCERSSFHVVFFPLSRTNKIMIIIGEGLNSGVVMLLTRSRSSTMKSGMV